MDERIINFEANFSVLDRYGENVTNNEFITNPAIGRDEQIKELILILLTPEKSAILIGKPGIGKTAIVEGLAYRIQKNDVPDALKGYTIINIKTASLLGTMPSGESKVQKMIDELKKRDKVILFIDEIHMLIGSTDSSSLDFACFKPKVYYLNPKVIKAYREYFISLDKTDPLDSMVISDFARTGKTKFASLCWRNPQSGKFTANNTFITKASNNNYPRYYLLEATGSVIHFNDDYKAFY